MKAKGKKRVLKAMRLKSTQHIKENSSKIYSWFLIGVYGDQNSVRWLFKYLKTISQQFYNQQTMLKKQTKKINSSHIAKEKSICNWDLWNHAFNSNRIYIPLKSIWGLSLRLSGKETAYSGGDAGMIPREGRSLEKEIATHCGKSHVQRSLVGYSPWGNKKSLTQFND